MNPDAVSSVSVAIYILLALCSIGALIDSSGKTNKHLKKVIILEILLIPVVWLVSPWVGLGLHSIHRKNTGLVNDLQRQEKVLEPEDRVRESKADNKN